MSYKIDISAPGVSKLNNDEYAQFVKDVLKLVASVSMEQVGVQQEVVSAMQKNLELLTEASRQNRSSKESETIAKMDKQRNSLLSYLLSSFRVGRKSSLEAHQKAAGVLFVEFKHYKGVASLPSRQKSQAIDAFIKDMEKPELSKHISTLGVSHAVPALKEVNKQYQELVGVRSENQMSISEINVRKVRKENDVRLKQLITHAFATNVVSPTPESQNFMNLLAKTADDALVANKQRLAQLLARGKKASKESVQPKAEEGRMP